MCATANTIDELKREELTEMNGIDESEILPLVSTVRGTMEFIVDKNREFHDKVQRAHFYDSCSANNLNGLRIHYQFLMSKNQQLQKLIDPLADCSVESFNNEWKEFDEMMQKLEASLKKGSDALVDLYHQYQSTTNTVENQLLEMNRFLTAVLQKEPSTAANTSVTADPVLNAPIVSGARILPALIGIADSFPDSNMTNCSIDHSYALPNSSTGEGRCFVAEEALRASSVGRNGNEIGQETDPVSIKSKTPMAPSFTDSTRESHKSRSAEKEAGGNHFECINLASPDFQVNDELPGTGNRVPMDEDPVNVENETAGPSTPSLSTLDQTTLPRKSLRRRKEKKQPVVRDLKSKNKSYVKKNFSCKLCAKYYATKGALEKHKDTEIHQKNVLKRT